MLTTLVELDRQDAAIEAALREATDAPLPAGAQCSNCDHFVDYSGDLYARVLDSTGAFEYTNWQIGTCIKQMANSGYQAACPNCHHGRQRKLPCHAHTSTRRHHNRCPGWEPNWDWLHGPDTEF